MLIYQDIVFDPAHNLAWRSGAAVHLTRTEGDLFGYLLQRKGVAVSRDELLSNVWGWPTGHNTRTVDVYIARLRRKLGLSTEQLVSVFGVGYFLRVRPCFQGG